METLFVGKNVIFLPEVDSTNSYAIDLLKNVNLPEGTVVHAAHQTRGKGQRGARWSADPARNLTASIILKPGSLDIKNQFFLYQVAALACYDALAEILANSQIDIKIKWPNDILVNKSKIAGILIENHVQNNRLSWCVAGIGINVNQERFEEQLRATSLKQITGIEYQVEHVLELLCRHFEKHYLALMNARFQAIKKNYLEHLYGLNEYLDFEMEGKKRNLRVKGLGDSGLLLLADKHEKEMEVDVKEIKWIY